VVPSSLDTSRDRVGQDGRDGLRGSFEFKRTKLWFGCECSNGLVIHPLLDCKEELLGYLYKIAYFIQVVVNEYIYIYIYIYVPFYDKVLYLLRHTCLHLYNYDAIYKLNQTKGWFKCPLP
jgi:hypothetical protein